MSQIEDYLSEFIYGSIDGIITTFSIVAGSAGGNLAKNVIIVLGISNVLSDGYSMGVSRYLSAVAEQEQELITHIKPPWAAGLITFLSFVCIGLLPILPFLMFNARHIANRVSLLIALVMFFIIGLIKGLVIKTGMPFRNGLKSLFIGVSAALISFFVGKYVGEA